MLKFFKNLKLAAKLNVIFLCVFLAVIGINSLILSQVLQGNAEHEVTRQASMLLETMGAVRDYTSAQVNPELAPRLETEEQFLPQTVPGYSAREVFENLRKQEEYNNFFYKEATLNPTNLRDKADKFEKTIVDQFRQKNDLKELTGFRDLPGGEIYYVARPIAINKESCLRCHSTPEAAPKSQLATYGSENGFGWQLNEVVGAKIISVPANKILLDARRLQFLVIGILSLGFLLTVIVLNLFLKLAIVSPVTRMAQWSKELSTGQTDAEFKYPSKDEIGILAASLNRLRVSLVMAMDMLNQKPGDP
jgi:HAMP domain-containing protein